jgi:[acyl-carrier-protein] S-malonyltransferase
MNYKKIAFIFPGQGAQYVKMGHDFFRNFSVAREVFEEADEILQRKLSSLIFQGPEQLLTETKNSQLAIYATSMALLKTLKSLFPSICTFVSAGLSLGEYSALTSSGFLDYASGLRLVQYRGQYMNDACEETQGAMAVIVGLEASDVEEMVKQLSLPNDLWAANFNCPGQVVISGTLKGIEVGMQAAKAKGAKRALPLQVHGAFHSGLMKKAEERLKDHIDQALLKEGTAKLVMNVPGDFVSSLDQIRQNLIKQVVSPVRWEQGVSAMKREGVDLFIEIGCGKTLAGMNKRIDPAIKTISIEKIDDLKELEMLLK